MAGSFESGGVYDFVLREAAAKSIFHKGDGDDSDEDESPQSDDCEARLTAAVSRYGKITTARNTTMLELSHEFANAMKLQELHRTPRFTGGR